MHGGGQGQERERRCENNPSSERANSTAHLALRSSTNGWYAPSSLESNMNALKRCALGFGIVASLTALAGGHLSAQAPAAAPPDYSKVEIQATQLAPNFYRFEAVGPV